MSANYILLKVHGNWLDREQIKGHLKIFLTDPRIEILENGIVGINSAETLTNAESMVYDPKDLESFTKKSIANSLGFFLLEEGWINFQKEISSDTVKTTGCVLIVNDPSTKKEGEQK